jgi:hypothetical protein
LPHDELHLPNRLESLTDGRRFLAVLILAVGLTSLGIAAAFDARYTVVDGFFYAGQPAKSAAYRAGALATPFLMALSFWLSRRWMKNFTNQARDRVIWTGLVLYWLLMASCAVPLIYCPDPPFWILPPSWILRPFDFFVPFYTPARLLILLGAGGVEFYFLTARPSRRVTNRAWSLLLIIWVLLIPSRFYLPSKIDDSLGYLYHLNAVLDALSQSVNGHHILVDFPHIYGGYIEMLAPIIRFFPRHVGVLIAALAVPHVLGMLCLLLIARLVIPRPSVLFICGLTLLGAGYLSSAVDLNYGYLTARVFFPPVGLLAATLYFRQPGPFRYAATSALAALASIWNLDTGLAFWASWLGTLLIMELAARKARGFVRHLLIQMLSFGGAWIAFFLYLRLATGQWPDLGLLFYFQKLVVESGYFCLRLLFPDMWVFILGVYVTALGVAFGGFVRGTAGWTTPVMLLLSLFGIGIFSYFMGRSAPSNLISVAYPAILLAGLLCAEGETLMRRRLLPALTRFFLLPSRIALFWWASLMIVALPDLLTKSWDVAGNWNDPGQTPLLRNAAFITRQVAPHEDGVYFLSNHSGLYYYLSDTLRPIRIPGMIELLRAQDMNALIEAIRSRQFHKLFVEEDFYAIQMYRPDLYEKIHDSIDQNYRVSQVGPDWKLVLYTPR